jgi:hypothetical protein
MKESVAARHDVRFTKLGGRRFISLYTFARRGLGRRVYWRELGPGETNEEALERAWNEMLARSTDEDGE